MSITDIVELLGCSISRDLFQKMKLEFEFSDKEEWHANSNVLNEFKRYSCQSQDENISVEFMAKKRFKSEFFKLKKEDNPNENNELILSEITLYPNETKLNLPFGLNLHESIEEVKNKLSKFLVLEDNLADRFQLKYSIDDDYKLLLTFTSDEKLKWMRIWILDIDTFRFIERRRNIDNMSKYIIPEKAPKIITFIDDKPTTQWQFKFEEMEEQEEYENLFIFCQKADILFDKFIYEVSDGTKMKDARYIYNATEVVVKELNKLNETYEEIHTMEREDICDFIEKIILETGFKIEEGDDITWEWRNW